MSDVWNLHTHSRFSHNDALPDVADLVSKAKRMGQPALGLTDHGNMAGSVQLYKACRDEGILPFPGTELYVVKDRYEHMSAKAGTKPKRHHMCIVAYTTRGYENLVKISTISHQNFYNKPLVGFHDFAEWHEDGLLEGIAATSGCYFGYIAQAVERNDFAEAKRLMSVMDKWFGKFYVELQNHRIDHGNGSTDDDIAESLLELADSMGLPMVVTQDSHYTDITDKIHHESLKRLVSFGPDADDAVFPGDGFHLADEGWFYEHHNEDRFNAGAEGLKDLLGSHDLRIKELDTYHYNIPFTTADPDSSLRRRTERALSDMLMGKNAQKYLDRLNEELEIVKDTGMAGYLLLVAMVTDWCQQNHVFYQARGSASGSVICWLLGITQSDPIKYGMDFSRFISRDRTKPPDIDLDVEKSRRQDVIDMLGRNHAALQIGTWMEMSIKGDEETGSGSIFVKYKSKWNNTNPDNKINGWSDLSGETKNDLIELAKYAPYSSVGTHAAGVIVSTTQHDIDRLVPHMRVGKKNDIRYVSQYDMDDVEALGLVKLDILGSATLEILHVCMENLGRNIEDGLSWIPLSDSGTYRMIARGQTDAVFQLEGWAARRGVRELKPSKLDDIVASMALFRPATMNSGATSTYIRRKHNEARIPDLPPILRKHTLKTYGTIIYQDQVIWMLRDMGMDPDNLTKFLKAVKASNANIGNAGKVIEAYHDQIKDMAESHGIVGDTWDWFWDSISGFAAYSFNYAHSTAYGLMAYRCAYLVHHHPTEFFSAVLTVWTDTKKEEEYIKAARQRDLKFRKASLNKSMMGYTPLREGVILRGLPSIDGVGKISAKKIIESRPEGGFTSIDHFAQCMGTKISGVKAYKTTGDTDAGVFGALMKAGLFDALEG